MSVSLKSALFKSRFNACINRFQSHPSTRCLCRRVFAIIWVSKEAYRCIPAYLRSRYPPRFEEKEAAAEKRRLRQAEDLEREQVEAQKAAAAQKGRDNPVCFLDLEAGKTEIESNEIDKLMTCQPVRCGLPLATGNARVVWRPLGV